MERAWTSCHHINAEEPMSRKRVASQSGVWRRLMQHRSKITNGTGTHSDLSHPGNVPRVSAVPFLRSASFRDSICPVHPP